MLTTIIGFGCLMIAEHRGIRSLGFVMVIGLGVTLLACYTALPALLRLRTRTESITAEGRLARRVARVATAARPRRRPAGARH
jgi:predicted exporter